MGRLVRKKAATEGAEGGRQQEKDIFKIARTEIRPESSIEVVVLESLSAKGLLAKHDQKSFLEMYELAPAKYAGEILHEAASWQTHLAETTASVHESIAKADIHAALAVAVREYPPAEQRIRLMLNLEDKEAGVQASADCALGGIVMVLLTNYIRVRDPNKPDEKSEGDFPVMYKENKGNPFEGNVRQFFLERPSYSEKSAIVPFWRMQGTADRNKVNMGIVHMEVSILGNVNATPKFLGGCQRLVAKTPTFEASARHSLLELPVAYNTRSVKAGEALFLYREKKDDDKKGPKGIDSKRLLHRALAQDPAASSSSQAGAAPEPLVRKRARRLPGDPAPPPPPPPPPPAESDKSG